MSAIDAKIITVTSEGVYQLPSKIFANPTNREIKFAREQALLNAKYKSSEEAGTTVYSIYSSKQKDGENIATKSDIQAISSSVITYDVIEESWCGNEYKVTIKASVDSKDAEEVFNNADKRLQKIKSLQDENIKIVEQIQTLTQKMIDINKNNYTLQDYTDISSMSEYLKFLESGSSRLYDEYEKNTLLMKGYFKKGALVDKAEVNEVLFEKSKNAFDSLVMDPFKKNLVVKILNIDVVKKGEFADIEFILVIAVKNRARISQEVRPWIDGIELGRDIYKDGQGYSSYLFNSKLVIKKLVDWIEQNRSLVVEISLGDRVYITERLAYLSRSYIFPHLRFTEKARYEEGYRVFNNTHPYLSYRVMKNVPINEIQNLDTLRADAVYRDININTEREKIKNNLFSLHTVREASEFY